MPDSNRRQDFRIDDMIPMSDIPLSKSDYELEVQHVSVRSRQGAMLQEMLGKELLPRGSKDSLNSDVSSALETLDAKLNYLIGVNMVNDASQHNLKEKAVNLSVTGASFYSHQRYKEGDFIKVNMMLPSFPPTTVELVGIVTWVREKSASKNFHIGVRFTYRGEIEENTLAKYIFQRHREMLRLRAREKEENT